MKIRILSNILFAFLLLTQQGFAQDCKTTADLETAPGKFLTAAQSKWPTDYSNLTAAADKTQAKKTLNDIEKTEAKSHEGFTLTGGNWENNYSTKGYAYLGNTKLAQYTFQSALYEFFCSNGKSIRNSEYSTVLRMYVNALSLTTLDRFLSSPFGSSFGSYDFGMQYADWKNHKPADVNAKLIELFTYISCNNSELLQAMNSGKEYFQDVSEKNITPNSRNNPVYRYWFIKKNDLPVLIPVSRKEYLQSLLEYYEREKIHFTKLVAKLKSEHDNSIKYYTNWKTDVAGKIEVVKKALNENSEEWLTAQAIINPAADNEQRYNARLPEQTNYNRFWKFYDKENKSAPLYKYNPAYFTNNTSNSTKPQIITIVFRYVTMPSSLRMLNNFTKKFDFELLKNMVE